MDMKTVLIQIVEELLEEEKSGRGRPTIRIAHVGRLSCTVRIEKIKVALMMVIILTLVKTLQVP